MKLPSVKVFKDALEKRHDIVHRSGHDRDGNPIVLDHGRVVMLSAKVEEFCQAVASSFYANGEF